MSLQKASVPALLIEAGAWIDDPPPGVVVAAVVAALFLPPPHPAARNARTRRMRAPAGATSFERATTNSFRSVGLSKIRLSDLLVAKKRLRVVGKCHRPCLEHVAPARHLERHH